MRLSMLEHGYVVAVTVAFAWEMCRRRAAQEKIDQLVASGAIDIEPVIAATEDVVAALRLNGARCRRSADVVAIPARP